MLLFRLAQVTFYEILRDRVLYASLVAGALLMGASFVISGLTFIRPERIVADFGYSVVLLINVLAGILLSCSLLSKETERRTLHVVLAHPVPHWVFVSAKYLGLLEILILNGMLMGMTYILILWMMTGQITGILFSGVYFAILQAALAAAITLVLSTYSTATLSALMALGVYCLGLSQHHLRLALKGMKSETLVNWIQPSTYVLPNFSNLSIGRNLTYSIPLTLGDHGFATAYVAAWVFFLLVMAGFLFQRRDLP